MKTKYLPLTVLLLCILELSCGYTDERKYHIERTNHGPEEEIKITDINGHSVANIGLNLEEKEDISVCYDRVPLPPGGKGIVSKTEKCGDRPVFLLAKRDCSSVEGTDREKRGTHSDCTYSEHPSTLCVEEESYCEKNGWLFRAGKCKSWGIRCKRYEVVRTKTYNNCPIF